MSRRLLIAGIVSSLAFSSVQARAKEIPDPGELATNLQQLQTKISQGDAVASLSEPKLLRDMALAFSEADASVWDKKSNVDAAVIYLMSGGAPEALTSLRLSSKATAEQRSLLDGVLAYVSGRREEAVALLGGLDPARLDPSIAGQIAFAQSVLASKNDSRKAAKALDYARLLAPGGLVEEASLRREALLLAMIPDTGRSLQLTEQYLIRFPHSRFAPSFIASFLKISSSRDGIKTSEDLRTFDSLARLLPQTDHLRVLLAISRQNLLGARLHVAKEAADLALRLTSASSVDKERARLYQAGADLTTDRYDAAVVQLRSIDATGLPRKDLELAQALNQLAMGLRKPARLDASMNVGPEPGASGGVHGPQDENATIQLTQGVLQDVQAALGENRR